MGRGTCPARSRRLERARENHQYSRRLDELADLLEIQGDSPFRIRAYRNAARLIETMARPVDELAAAGPARLRELPAIGPDLARKLVELHHTGGLAMLETLRRDVPPSLIQLTRISGPGPKRAMRLWQALGVATIDPPEEAARVLAVAREEGVFLEINAQPDRLDLSDVHARRAAAAGVRVAISTDAHRLRELDFMARGVDPARRGWIEACDVANARPLEESLSGLRAVRSPGPRR